MSKAYTIETLSLFNATRQYERGALTLHGYANGGSGASDSCDASTLPQSSNASKSNSDGTGCNSGTCLTQGAAPLAGSNGDAAIGGSGARHAMVREGADSAAVTASVAA